MVSFCVFLTRNIVKFLINFSCWTVTYFLKAQYSLFCAQSVVKSKSMDFAVASSKLEADVKRLKSELQSSRCLEQELRSQITSLSFSDRTTKSELYRLQQEN